MSLKPARILPIIALCAMTVLSACGSGSAKSDLVEGKVNVVTSFYPLYYFASEIGGDRANVVNLIPAGVEPHDWTPKSGDIDTTSNAQLFLYNGAGLEGWMEGFLKGLGSDSKVVTVETSKGIDLIEGNPEEEGHHADEAEPNTGEQHASAEHDHSGLEVDPHTWVSPRSAMVMAANIFDAYVKADPDHKAEYESRYEDLSSRLKALDSKFKDGLAGFAKRDIVVSHQAFGYLCRDYKLNQVAIMGLSPEAEPRAQDLLQITQFVKEHDVRYIFFEELVSDQLAETLAAEAKVDTLVLNPVEGLTPEQEQAGDNYFTLMERNLENLQKALQCLR
ncbi:ABC transporter substrate-binding protein [Cohnella kolymensis]|uniref:ABC transporter substrate-binding protein n=1 Tax=Cohnella kolymensis TaxID=1590652 RepID=A0ABR5A091_9BACL|nr:metal ABC transporter substrate-binding protein [Cohnella kolymensis]KIL34342.1 ABC transporter substrate-binding protein [Cohnella kolymensis]